MAIRSKWRAEAADLIQIELQQKLRNDFDIVKVEPDQYHLPRSQSDPPRRSAA